MTDMKRGHSAAAERLHAPEHDCYSQASRPNACLSTRTFPGSVQCGGLVTALGVASEGGGGEVTLDGPDYLAGC